MPHAVQKSIVAMWTLSNIFFVSSIKWYLRLYQDKTLQFITLMCFFLSLFLLLLLWLLLALRCISMVFLCVSCLYRECSYCARKSHTHCYGLMSFYVWKAFAVTTKRMPAKLSKNTQSKRARRTMRVKTSSRFDLRPVERMQHFSTHSHFVTIFKLIE